MKYIILIFLLAIVSCNDAEDDEIYINDFPHRISEPPLLDNKGDTAFIIMTPAEGWRLHAAGTVVNKDSIALNVKMTHTFLLEEDWFSIKKEQEDSVMTVIVDENTSGDIRGDNLMAFLYWLINEHIYNKAKSINYITYEIEILFFVSYPCFIYFM
ncbi:hypothetical protein NXV74_00395 [Bacteroides thetaiotaomicron]|nr:hypothetical protein [Bacteroides thetaiotaomicron]